MSLFVYYHRKKLRLKKQLSSLLILKDNIISIEGIFSSTKLKGLLHQKKKDEKAILKSLKKIYFISVKFTLCTKNSHEL